MKFRAATMFLVAAALAWPAGSGRAQLAAGGRATDFTSSTYYDPPHETQIKLRLSGAEAAPLPGGLLDIKQLRIETFNVDGKPELTIDAPQCTYAPLTGTASSAGSLKMRTGDGKLRVAGEGFLWRQDASLITISNNVHTLIDLPAFKAPAR